MKGPLEGRVALVTGAGRGLGRHIALHLAGLGATVGVNDIDPQSAREFDESLTASSVTEECAARAGQAVELTADVTDPLAVETMVADLISDVGRLDVVVNAAGGVLVPPDRPSSAATMSAEDFSFIVGLNLGGTVNVCRAAVPALAAAGGGAIVNFSSQASLRSRPDATIAHYSVAKAGVNHFTRLLAVEVGRMGIRVNAVAPGLILTSRAVRQGRGEAAFRSAAEARIPLRRMGTPDDVASVVEFLVTDASSYVTGQVIGVCGGNTIPGV